MPKEYDFSKATRASDVPHLAKLQAQARGKSRITIMLDNDVLLAFRAKADAEGIGYQTLINQTLRAAAGSRPVDEATLRRILREELGQHWSVSRAASLGSLTKTVRSQSCYRLA